MERGKVGIMSYKTTARVVGILFIIATAAAIVGETLLLPSIESTFLTEAAAAETRVITGVLLEVVLAISVVGIAVMIFPVLKKQNDGMALGYVGARTLEGVLVLGGAITALLLLTLSRDYGDTGAAGVEPLGDVLLAAREWTYWLGPMLMFSVSALILYTMLFRAQLVPSWLSIWGFIGGALLLLRAVLEMYGAEFSTPVQALIAAPIGINEMVLALWLIVKGLNSSALGTGPEEDPTLA
jgi:hypothetical protein